MAASKCRQKKKEGTHDLEEKKFKLLQKNTILKGELEKLTGELSSFKAALLLHSDCDYPAFQIWRENEARRAANSSPRDAPHLPNPDISLEGALDYDTRCASSPDGSQSSSSDLSFKNKSEEPQKRNAIGMPALSGRLVSHIWFQESESRRANKAKRRCRRTRASMTRTCPCSRRMSLMTIEDTSARRPFQ